MSAARARKLADRVQEIVAGQLQRGIKDPRLGFVTITDVRVTNDLREAVAFYTAFGDEQERAASAAALESLTGMLRTEVGRQTGIKFTPTLAFQLDAVPENASRIDDLLTAARAADAEVERIAAEATYAGDADPYRHPVEDGEDGEDGEHGEDGEDGERSGDAPAVAGPDIPRSERVPEPDTR